MLFAMNGVTQILSKIESGDIAASQQLFPLVYDELRGLAAAKLAHENPGQTLQATALVHEAYLRLVGDASQTWVSRGHFFAAAAEAMRKILVDNARRKKRLRRGGNLKRQELADAPRPTGPDPATILAVDESLEQLAAEDAIAAAIVRLRFFAGLSMDDVADALGVSRATAYRHWAYARAWLKTRLPERDPDESE
jgi:RNA polymerase sigma factor (TIGR02999 family)